MESRWHNAEVLAARFPEDDGALAHELADALAAYAVEAAAYPSVLHALQAARLLVPIVAVLSESATTDAGLTVDKSSQMATVTVTGVDGRRALLAFTHLGALQAWAEASGHTAVRPAPVPTYEAARAALGEGAEALVIDLGASVTVAIEGADLQGLAEGWQLARLSEGTAWIRPGLTRSASLNPWLSNQPDKWRL